jgi:hypothetical protein
VAFRTRARPEERIEPCEILRSDVPEEVEGGAARIGLGFMVKET